MNQPAYKPTQPRRIAVSNRWLLLYPLIIALTVAGFACVWDAVSDPIPMHYNAAFIVDRIAPKEPLSLAPLVIIQCALALTFVGCHFLGKHVPAEYIHIPGQLTPTNEPQVRLLASRFLLVIGLFCNIFLGANFLLLVTNSLNAPLSIASLILFLVVIIGGCVWLWKRDKALGGG
jgi:uncharacterized membrane protein